MGLFCEEIEPSYEALQSRIAELEAALREISTCAGVGHGFYWNGGRNPILLANAALSQSQGSQGVLVSGLELGKL